ncbi:MAG: 6-phospho-beta-glucosidase [Planctomycetes bacterium]|nr:6-phospho-beta-glucosidase [Planctomycetota bacterium]
MKIAIIGGGSTYTPELIEGFIQRREALRLGEVALHDIDPARLEVIGAFARRMVAAPGAGFAVTATTDLAPALEGAEFVITQVRVGGQAARHQDILLGLRHGLVGQETTGVGGFAKALRTIPAMRRIMREVKARCPAAWVLNFTNPSSIITEAITREGGVKVIGLCNIPIDVKMTLAAYLKVSEAALDIDSVGLNHLSWVRDVKVNGESVMARLIEDAIAGRGPQEIPEMAYEPEFLRALGYLPSPYLRYFYEPARMVDDLRAAPKTRAEEVMEIEAELLAWYRDPRNATKPAALGKRGGAWYSRLAVEIIDAIVGDRRAVHVVNTPNRGAVDFLPPEAVVEIPAVISREGAAPLPVGRVDAAVLGLMQQVKAYESLTVEAGIFASRAKALLALVAHPHVRSVSLARALLDDIVATNGLTLA